VVSPVRGIYERPLHLSEQAAAPAIIPRRAADSGTFDDTFDKFDVDDSDEEELPPIPGRGSLLPAIPRRPSLAPQAEAVETSPSALNILFGGSSNEPKGVVKTTSSRSLGPPIKPKPKPKPKRLSVDDAIVEAVRLGDDEYITVHTTDGKSLLGHRCCCTLHACCAHCSWRLYTA
jgi:hypothetical protein